ncbi:MAG: hypothetical protein WD266_02265 [Balneolales bacterium]
MMVFTTCNRHQYESVSLSLEKEGYTSLFNGNDLEGWKIPEGDGANE